jgi:hypothetical protein
MRARIIFRGLTLFTFEKNSRGAAADDNLGLLTAWLVSDPTHASMPLHHHTPLYALVARDVDSPDGPGHSGAKREIGSDMRIELVNHKNPPSGVVVDQSFLDYVPSLGDLHWYQGSRVQDPAYITRKIEIPSGRIRAGEFISWDWRGKTPARVAYMGTQFEGYGANEVIVDIGDDADIDADDSDYFLSISDLRNKLWLWPRVKGSDVSNDIDPNTVEVMISNLPARRRRAVFWGLHYPALFQAAGYPPRDYTTSQQYQTFEATAKAYDPYEWGNDAMMVQAGQPFPFIANPDGDVLGPIGNAARESSITKPPSSPGRQRGEGIPKDKGNGGHQHGGKHAGHDPQNTQICPFGRE